MKIMGQPHRKACKLHFHRKICGNFFEGPPLQGSTILRAPFLDSRAKAGIFQFRSPHFGSAWKCYKNMKNEYVNQNCSKLFT